MDELPAKAAALLAAARRAHQPTSADSERVRAALEARLTDVTAEPHTEPSAGGGAAFPGTWASGLGKVLVLAALAGSAALWASGSLQRSQPPTRRASEVPGSVRPSAPDAASLAPVLPAREPELATAPHRPSVRAPQSAAMSARATGASAKRAKRALVARTAETPAHVAESSAAPSAGSAAAHGAPQASIAPAPAPAPGLAPRPDEAASASADRPLAAVPIARAEALPPAAHAEAGSRTGAELALIRAALESLGAGKAAEALQRLDVHAARYPAGVMAEERIGLRAIALCATGQIDAGLAEQRRFLRQAPSSALTARVRRACPTSAP